MSLIVIHGVEFLKFPNRRLFWWCLGKDVDWCFELFDPIGLISIFIDVKGSWSGFHLYKRGHIFELQGLFDWKFNRPTTNRLIIYNFMIHLFFSY